MLRFPGLVNVTFTAVNVTILATGETPPQSGCCCKPICTPAYTNVADVHPCKCR